MDESLVEVPVGSVDTPPLAAMDPVDRKNSAAIETLPTAGTAHTETISEGIPVAEPLNAVEASPPTTEIPTTQMCADTPPSLATPSLTSSEPAPATATTTTADPKIPTAEQGPESTITPVAAPPPEDPRMQQFRAALGDAIIRAIDADLPIYLDGFGIIIPEIATGTRTRLQGDQIISRAQSTRTISFEKCRELTSYHLERFERLLDTKEVIHRIHHLLATMMDDALSEHDIRRHTRTIIHQFRRELIQRGHATLFPELGTFYALHNRQGNAEADWFAGADIFLAPAYERLIHEGPTTVMQRAVLDDAWELPTAAFGSPLVTHVVALADEIKKLGYEVENGAELKALGNGEMHVAVFYSPRNGGILTYCTNGIRALARESVVGNEFVLQIPCQGWSESSTPTEVPRWPVRALTLAWLLLTSSRSRSLKVGAGVAGDAPLLEFCDTSLRGVFTTPYALIRAEQQAVDRSFYYLNIIGITGDEAKIAECLSPNHLLALLQHRGLDQVTKANRSSVIARSHFAYESAVMLATPPAINPETCR